MSTPVRTAVELLHKQLRESLKGRRVFYSVGRLDKNEFLIRQHHFDSYHEDYRLPLLPTGHVSHTQHFGAENDAVVELVSDENVNVDPMALVCMYRLTVNNTRAVITGSVSEWVVDDPFELACELVKTVNEEDPNAIAPAFALLNTFVVSHTTYMAADVIELLHDLHTKFIPGRQIMVFALFKKRSLTKDNRSFVRRHLPRVCHRFAEQPARARVASDRPSTPLPA